MFIPNIFKKSNDTTAHLNVSDRVFIPGISLDVPVLLVTPIKGQIFPRCAFMSSNNIAFISTFGTAKFAAVTKDFMAISHREQIAEMIWSWLDYDRDINGLIDFSAFPGAKVTEASFEYELDDEIMIVESGDTESIGKMVTIAALVGKKAAKSVQKYHAHCVVTTATSRIKDAKKAGQKVIYTKKAFGTDLKDDGKINRIILKRAKKTGKTMLNAELTERAAEKKTAKAEKKAAKAAAKDITDEVENITSHLANDSNGPEPEGNPA